MRGAPVIPDNPLLPAGHFLVLALLLLAVEGGKAGPDDAGEPLALQHQPLRLLHVIRRAPLDRLAHHEQEAAVLVTGVVISLDKTLDRAY